MITIRTHNYSFTDEHFDAIKVSDFEDIKNCKRLFYELIEDHKKTGFFKEIEDVAFFIEGEEFHQRKGIKSNCLSTDYINHHNFHVIY